MKKLFCLLFLLLFSVAAEAFLWVADQELTFEQGTEVDGFLVRLRYDELARPDIKKCFLKGKLPGKAEIEFRFDLPRGRKEILIPRFLAERVNWVSIQLDDGGCAGVGKVTAIRFRSVEEVLRSEEGSCWLDPGIDAFFRGKPVPAEDTRYGNFLLLFSLAAERREDALLLLNTRKADPGAKTLGFGGGDWPADLSEGCNALLLAALNDDRELFDLLLAAGAEDRDVSWRGTPLLAQYISRGKSVGMLRHMIQKGCDPAKDGFAAVCSGAWRTDAEGMEMMKYLISLGVPLDHRTQTSCYINYTPVKSAIMRNNREMILLLLESGAPYEEKNWEFAAEWGGFGAHVALAEYANRKKLPYKPFKIAYGWNFCSGTGMSAKLTGTSMEPGPEELKWEFDRNDELFQKYGLMEPETLFVWSEMRCYTPGEPVQIVKRSGWDEQFRELLRQENLTKEEAKICFRKCIALWKETPAAQREKVLSEYIHQHGAKK